MIGLFGGTFDPIHLGHLRPALDVMESLGLSQIRFVPGALPPHRAQPYFTAEQRAEMVDLAIAEQEGFILDRRELDRNTNNSDRPSYTIDTLESFREEFGASTPLFLLLGTDAFLGLLSWHRWDEIHTLANIVVMTRPGYSLDKDSDVYATYESFIVEPERIQSKAAGQVTLIPVTQFDVSATDIRQCLKDKASVNYLVPSQLSKYLTDNDFPNILES